MIRAYDVEDGLLREQDCSDRHAGLAEATWIDMLEPSDDQEHAVESTLGVEVPTPAEMRSLEASAQLYRANNAVVMNARAISTSDASGLRLVNVTFILTQGKLITLRYGDPAPFREFVARAEREIAHLSSGAAVMVGLLETIVDRTARLLETVGDDLETLSTDIFARDSSASAVARNTDLRPIMQRIGANGDLATRTRESLLSFARLIPFLQAETSLALGPDLEARLTTAARDIASLLDHDSYLAANVTFLLDATLGLINIQQNGIIKIFSVAAVVFMPPTLIASIYGMNFAIIPELHWTLGYPYALVLMVCSAVLPFYYFKRRRWL